MRDYLSEAVARRRYVVGRLEGVSQRYGFQPLETLAIENLSALLGKYKEEGDQLLFWLLHRGDELARALANEAPKAEDLAELGLRYDLTVPLARVIAQYSNSLPESSIATRSSRCGVPTDPQKGGSTSSGNATSI